MNLQEMDILLDNDVKEDMFEVDKIVGMKTNFTKRTIQFRVKRAGPEDVDNNWLPLDELNCQLQIEMFLDESGRRAEYEKLLFLKEKFKNKRSRKSARTVKNLKKVAVVMGRTGSENSECNSPNSTKRVKIEAHSDKNDIKTETYEDEEMTDRHSDALPKNSDNKMTESSIPAEYSKVTASRSPRQEDDCEKGFLCKFCPFQTIRQSEFRRHALVHTKEKRFQCELCTYVTNVKHSLKTHSVIHVGEKIFSCEFCSFKAHHKSNLTAHILIHTGEKPFACEMCPYKTSRNEHLKTHILTHTGEKPFSCQLCSYKTKQKQSLKIHMFTHTKEKPFSCQLCSYETNRRQILKTHMLTHAKEEHLFCD